MSSDKFAAHRARWDAHRAAVDRLWADGYQMEYADPPREYRVRHRETGAIVARGRYKDDALAAYREFRQETTP